MRDQIPPMSPFQRSSFLAGMHHDPSTGALHVQFKNGDVWKHSDVGMDKAVTFQGALSPGSFYNDRIKGNHEGVKVKEGGT